jgi:hypothetical protein
MAKAGGVPAGHLADGVFRQAQVPLRADQAHMARIGREEQQVGVEDSTLFVPEALAMDGQSVAKVVVANDGTCTHPSPMDGGVRPWHHRLPVASLVAESARPAVCLSAGHSLLSC